MISEKLKGKLKKLDKDDKNADLNEADVEGTPYEVYKRIFNRLGIGRIPLSDPCPYVDYWNIEECYDALNSDWMGELIYLNHPFSKTAAFMVKIMEQYLKGKSIIFLVLN